MAINFLTPTQVAQNYMAYLKGMRPEVNIDQEDSDWWIRGRVLGGISSGIYQDQKKIQGDIFPQSARREAVRSHLETYLDDDFAAATQAQGFVGITGVDGATVFLDTEFVHPSTQNAYRATEEVVLDGTTGLVPVLSVDTGQDQNLFDNTALQITTPPAGINAAAVTVGNIADGRDVESTEAAVARLLLFIRERIRGGNEGDYRQWSFEASDAVTDVSIRRFILGFGTVGVFITSGTTDIDTALDNDQPIVRVPSDALVAEVEEYLEEQGPVTDCVTVGKPVEVPVDVTARVQLAEGYELTDVVNGLTIQELIEREIKRVLYKNPIGGRKVGQYGYVLASEIEENMDIKLSASPYSEGTLLALLVDRQIDDLSLTGANRRLAPQELTVPGTITITEGV